MMKNTLPEIIKEQMPPKPLLIALILTMLFAGYGIWATTNTGTLVINSPLYGSQVFIDQHLAGIFKETDNMRLSPSAGKHDIIISKEGYWPWTETVEIKKHQTTEVHPFTIPQKPMMESVSRFTSLSGVSSENPDYSQASALFKNLTVSDKMKPLVEATRIQGVTYADYVPGRTDVILVATKDGIFAVGIEKNEHLNFQPVYKKANSSFVKAKDDTLYIRDGDVILHIKNFSQ